MASKKQNDNMLVKMTALFFIKWKITLLIWVFLLGFGALTYTSIIKREGFPPISFPISFVSGAYPNQSKDAVDKDILVPLSEALVAEPSVTGVDVTANAGFFTAAITFDDSKTSTSGTELVQKVIDETSELPDNAIISAIAVDPGSFLLEFDLVAQVYSKEDASVEQLDMAAEYVAEQLEQLNEVELATAKNNLTRSNGGDAASIQTSFARVGLSSKEDDKVAFYGASTIGVDKSEGYDVLQLSDAVVEKLASLDLSQFEGDLETVVSADFAKNIRSNIDFLESNMLTGLLAVAFVSFLLISWRASLITGLFMMTVMVTTIIILYLVGYTLNVITLFALILSLGLFVDDATIAVEAIDVTRRDKKLKPLEAVKTAIRKVGMASLAGTLTTVLVFAVLATPTGILGDFIRLIPITVIIALLTSFVLSMTIIPFLSKYLILKSGKVSWITRVNPVLKLESWLGICAEKIILSVRTSRGKWFAAFSILVSILAVAVGMYIFGFKVDSNTFPPSKDANQLVVQIQFADAKDVESASEISEKIDQIVSDSIGDNMVLATYGGERLPDAQQASLVIDLVPFTEREIKAPEIAKKLSNDIESSLNASATVNVRTIDSGPPLSPFPFGVRVYADNDVVLAATTQSIADALVGSELENYNGDKITILSSKIDGVEQQVLRDNGRRYAITRLSYDSENPTVVSLLTEERFLELFDGTRLSALGVSLDDIEFDSGQEGDFQDSFNTLLLAIPIAMFLMYVLLAVQFRSLIQPFLILLAIPFTLLGVAYGLFLTDNAASFFALVGFIGLIGIAVNNTIMLTDYANQERRAGARAINAIATAAQKRLRPLITTTVTTVVALLPLALSDPFWEALAFTIIFGLISSTILVLLSFPYYYLGAEWLRMRFSKGTRRARKLTRSNK